MQCKMVFERNSMEKKKTIIIISVLAALVAVLMVWFEIPRIRIRNYIKTNLPEGHYRLYPNYGDFVTSNSMRKQSTDRIWHVYDKDRNFHFNIFQLNRENDIETKDSSRNDVIDLENNFRSNFAERYWAFLIYDKENDYHTGLTVEFAPDETVSNFEWRSISVISGSFSNREELDALFDDLYVPCQFYQEKNVPLSFGYFMFDYIYTGEDGNVRKDSFVQGTLENIEKAREEAYARMADINLE